MLLIAAEAVNMLARGINDSEKTANAGLMSLASAALHKWSPSNHTRPVLRYAVGSELSLRSSLRSGLSRDVM
jgi:hypothetical protein